MRGTELWSWTVSSGAWRAVPFGQSASDATEANALQLWSNLDLALECGKKP